MSFFRKLKDRLFKSSSKLEEGLDAIVEDGGVEEEIEVEVPDAPEPEAVAKPEPVPEPEPMVEEPAATGVMALSSTGYAVQVYAGKTEESVIRYQSAHGLNDLMMVKTERGGEIFFVLVSAHDDRATAINAAADLEQKTGSTPWVRSIAGLQKIAVE